MTHLNSLIVKNNSTKLKVKGFTLLEVLVAIAIFAIVSLSSVTIFDTVLRGDKSSQIRSARHNELQRAFLLIERDVTQMARRTMRINGEKPAETFLKTAEDSFLDGEQALAFVRNGWTNPGLLLPRSDVQAVAYRIEAGVLQRLHYNFVDAVNGEKPKIRPLISDVESLVFQFYDGKKWQESWTAKALPLAVAIEIDTQDYGMIRRQFLVAGDPLAKDDNT